jgi:4-amino-4-deoxychorismate lyase
MRSATVPGRVESVADGRVVANALVDGHSALDVPLDDRGLAYGDGLFETIRFIGGAAPLWRGHMVRLMRGCKALRLTAPPPATLHRDATLLAAQDDCIVKLIVTRADGRGYAGGTRARRIALRYAVPDVEPADYVLGVRARWCRLRLSLQPALAGLKHLNRLEQIIARAEWNDRRIREGLLCDADDRVIGATSANIFIVRRDRLLTPQLDRCGVAGVARAWIIAQAKRWLPVEECVLARKDIESADEVFLSNAVRGIAPIRAIASQRFGIGPVTRRLGYTLARLGIGRSPD